MTDLPVGNNTIIQIHAFMNCKRNKTSQAQPHGKTNISACTFYRQVIPTAFRYMMLDT